MGVRSHATITGRPASQLRCDVCGAPANWRQRNCSACCAYGEALCDACERRSRRRWAEKNGSLSHDFADLLGWIRESWPEQLRPGWGRQRSGQRRVPRPGVLVLGFRGGKRE